MEKKKYYHYTLEEVNGEQEYSYDYLIESGCYEEAVEIAEIHASTFYGDDAEKCDGSYVFFGGALCVEVRSVIETTKEAFIKSMLQTATLRSS